MKTQFKNITLLTALIAGTATAGNVTIPNTFTSGTKAVATEVNDNFTAVKTAVDDNQTQIDALSTGVNIPGNTAGDMQYWDGTAWVLLNAPTATTATLRFCGGEPSWDCIAVGDTGPAGGTVIFVNADGVTGLEAAPADLASTTWGCENTSTNIIDTSVGSGATNTSSLATLGCNAAVAASNHSFGGESDWFLPSKDELALLFAQQAVIGGFSSGLYWSSSENSAGSAWDQNFSNGVQGADGKQNVLNVRPIRAF